MKKITSLLFSFILASSYLFAGGDWAICAISITKNNESAYNYKLNEQNWTDGNWGSNEEFGNKDFGTPTSLTLNGAFGNGWTDDSPGYDATSFVLYYRVYKTGVTPGSWSQIALNNLSSVAGNNKLYDKLDLAIDVLALATDAGINAYTLEVAMSKNQYYIGGNWNSMIPDGQSIAYDTTKDGYKATFIKSNIPTELNATTQNLKITTADQSINVSFAGKVHIDLYTITGQLLHSATVSNQFTQNIKQGAYMLKINGDVHKILVK